MPADTPQTLRQAYFQRLDDGLPAAALPAAAIQAVALPDTWAARGLPLAGAGLYRLSVDLPRQATGVWALRIDRLSTVYALRINGVLVQQRGGPGGRSPAQPKPMPVLAEFPASLLHPGNNQIDIEWRLGFRAGLSAVQVGPSDALRVGFDSDHHLDQTVPLFLNAAGAALAGFMLLIWCMRRRETALGLFGLLWLLLSLRDISYYVNATPLPNALANALFFVAQSESVVLLCAFAIALSADAWPRFRRWLWVLAGALPLLCLVGAWLGQLEALRRIVYPGLIVLALAGLTVLWMTVRSARRWTLFGLGVGLTAVVGAGVHDFLFLQGWVPVTHYFWLPFAAPLGCMWFALVLVQRMVLALRSSEEQAARLELRVAERTLALDQAHQAQGRFLAAASHDLRQPVTAIGLLLGLAREREQAPAQRQLLDRAHNAARALEDLLGGLLDLSRLEGDAAAPRRQPVPLQAVFDAIAAHESSAAQAQGLRLRFAPTQLVVLTDALLLQQVLRNLVGNAVRHTERGGVRVVARRGAAGDVRLQVWDTGPGIAPADQKRIFEPFVQLANPGRNRQKGQGLGLAIVQRSLAALGHPLTLRSTPGRGSCFTVTLPLAPLQREPVPPGPAAAAALAGQRIWLLDDDTAVREALADRLTAWGATVTAHASLADLAQTLMADGPAPHGLLTDYRLPDGDGLQAVARVHARWGAVPALMLTGDTAPDFQTLAGAQGVLVLHKPAQAAHLLQALGQMLRVA